MALKGGVWDSVTDRDGSDAMKIRRYHLAMLTYA